MSSKIISSLSVATTFAAFALGIAAPGEARAYLTPAPCDKITGSGTVELAEGGSATFAATGGCKNGSFWGSVSFVDLATGATFSSTEISGYLWDPADPTAREICGLAVNNVGEDVFFRVRLVDRGEPGKNDAFGIAVDNRVTSGERFYILPAVQLDAGNVKLHKTNHSNSIDPALAGMTEFQVCGDLSSPQPQ
jgi:hypothetical protein